MCALNVTVHGVSDLHINLDGGLGYVLVMSRGAVK